MQRFTSISNSFHRTYSSWHHPDHLTKELSFLSIRGRLGEAIRLLRQTPHPTLSLLDTQSYLPLIRSCIKFKDFTKGKEIHKLMLENGVQPDLVLHNNIMIMYAKSGDLDFTRKVFDEMTERNLFSWTAVIGGYSNSGEFGKAVGFYEEMVLAGVKADNFLYPLVFKACGGMKELRSGRRVHADVLKSGFQWDLVVMNALVDMYVKCRSLRDAERGFCECNVRDVFTWTTMIVGYVQLGCGEEALGLFKEMMRSDVRPRSATFSGILPVYSNLGCLKMAKQVHGLAVVSGSDYDKFFGTALIDMYENCGGLGYARLVFERVKGRDVRCWNAMIKGYAQVGLFDEAVKMFNCMLSDGISPNKTTLDCVIPLHFQNGKGVLDLIYELEQMGLDPSVVGTTFSDHVHEQIDDIKQVKELHRYLSNSEYIADNSVASALVQLYAKFGDTDAAQGIFNSIKAKDLDCWSAIIECYAQNRYANKALELFASMRKTGIEPTLLIWNIIIAGFVDASDFDSALQMFIDMIWTNQNPDFTTFDIMLPLIQNNTCPMLGKELHCLLLRNECGASRFLSTAFINMYTNCGDVAYAVILFESMENKDLVSWNAIISSLVKSRYFNEASRIFDEMRRTGVVGNIITWTTMISGYARNGLVDKSLKHFRELQLEGLRPNSITIASILPACAQSATLFHGKSIHGYIIRNRLDNEDMYISNALIDMFLKCGCVEYAERVFRRLPQRDVVTWNTMIHGFAVYGNAKAALALFNQMEAEGVVPNNISFIEVLNACSHAGLVSEGWKYFNSMDSRYGIPPSGKHYACMVDILGRGGHLEDVRDFIVQMPLQPTASLWGAFLSACKTHRNVDMAEIAANHLIELQPDNPGNYVVLSNIYATAGRWNDVDRVRKMMVSRGVKKTPGCSWIELGNKIHVFAVENQAKQEMEEINRTVLDLAAAMIEEGYVPDVNIINFEDMVES